VPVEESPVNSQSSEHSSNSLDTDEAGKILTLVESFSLLSFYPYQKSIIDAVLEKKDTIVIQSTGNGKSLRFQFPPVHLQRKAIVIMPTISLMCDQSIQVNEHGITVAYGLLYDMGYRLICHHGYKSLAEQEEMAYQHAHAYYIRMMTSSICHTG